MNISKVNGSSPSFEGIRKVSVVVLPVEGKKALSKISMDIKDGFFMQETKSKYRTTIVRKGIATLTQFFNKDKYVGFVNTFTDGSYFGKRFFKSGISIEFSTFGGDKVGTTIYNKGKLAGHTSGDAYIGKKQNILTEKQVKQLFDYTKQLKGKGTKVKSWEELKKVVEDAVEKKQ